MVSDTINYTQFQAIDADTAGQIDVSKITLATNDASDFSLSSLSEASGLVRLTTTNDEANVLGTITTADVLAATGGTDLVISGDAQDSVDLTGWTDAGYGDYTQTTSGTEYMITTTGDISVIGVV